MSLRQNWFFSDHGGLKSELSKLKTKPEFSILSFFFVYSSKKIVRKWYPTRDTAEQKSSVPEIKSTYFKKRTVSGLKKKCIYRISEKSWYEGQITPTIHNNILFTDMPLYFGIFLSVKPSHTLGKDKYYTTDDRQSYDGAK